MNPVRNMKNNKLLDKFRIVVEDDDFILERGFLTG